jgi:cytochrome bd-type quinol oxidase subunit 2
MWALRLSVLVCFLLAIRGLGSAWTIIDTLEQYRTLAAGNWLIRVLIQAGFGVGFLVVGMGLWRRRRWAYHVWLPLLIAYTIIDVLWFVLYAQAEFDRQRLPFVLVTSFLGVCLLGWLTRRMRFE